MYILFLSSLEELMKYVFAVLLQQMCKAFVKVKWVKKNVCSQNKQKSFFPAFVAAKAILSWILTPIK
jgi:hypothetical protein